MFSEAEIRPNSQWNLGASFPNFEEKSQSSKKKFFFFWRLGFPFSQHTHKLHGDILLQFNGNSMFFIWLESLHPINNLSVIQGRVFLGWTSSKLGLMCLAHGHNAVTLVRLQPAAPRSPVKHSTTEPLLSLAIVCVIANYILEHYNKFPNLRVCNANFPNLKGPRAPSQNCKKNPWYNLIKKHFGGIKCEYFLIHQYKHTFGAQKNHLLSFDHPQYVVWLWN